LSGQEISKKFYAALTIVAIVGLPYLRHFNQLVFLNLTASMPTGFYIKSPHNKFNIGDIIVFYFVDKKINLIKYIAAHNGDHVCSDFDNTLWINGFSIAQKNTEKYPEESCEQSFCQQLKKDELFVIGEHPYSYDSRYFGPIKTHDVIATVKLIWPLK
jgi:signal peptidase I